MIRPIQAAEVFADPDAAALLEEYAAECSIPIIGQISPQPQIYEALERGGYVQILGAYEGGKLVGFASVLTTILPHYGRKVATVESLFVASESRSGGLGKDLLDAIDVYAKVSACEAILYSAPVGSTFEKLLSMWRNCVQTNSVWARRPL